MMMGAAGAHNVVVPPVGHEDVSTWDNLPTLAEYFIFLIPEQGGGSYHQREQMAAAFQGVLHDVETVNKMNTAPQAGTGALQDTTATAFAKSRDEDKKRLHQSRHKRQLEGQQQLHSTPRLSDVLGAALLQEQEYYAPLMEVFKTVYAPHITQFAESHDAVQTRIRQARELAELTIKWTERILEHMASLLPDSSGRSDTEQGLRKDDIMGDGASAASLVASGGVAASGSGAASTGASSSISQHFFRLTEMSSGPPDARQHHRTIMMPCSSHRRLRSPLFSAAGYSGVCLPPRRKRRRLLETTTTYGMKYHHAHHLAGVAPQGGSGETRSGQGKKNTSEADHEQVVQFLNINHVADFTKHHFFPYVAATLRTLTNVEDSRDIVRVAAQSLLVTFGFNTADN
ncbi:unnamed protein product [Amoebophrya sp. A120]|nr:unnamed protein product [Amoebophrya sp. A120]|eukprot:GSA120T00014298001.1